MPQQLPTGCINHPGIEAIARCRQCATPVCNGCVVAGPTGRFCSFECREKHEQFTRDAQGCELAGKRGGGFTRTLRKMVGRVVVLAAALFVLGVVCSMFEVPVLSGLTRMVRGFVGF